MEPLPRRAAAGLAFVLLATQLVVLAPTASAASCPISYSGADAVKPNKLFLYFPTSDDTSFPAFTNSYPVSPAKAFQASDLPSYTGTTAALRGAIRSVVVDDYCEFNVHVSSTLSPPTTSPPRRVVVAVGSDTNTSIYGIADEVDTGDAHAVNFARVFGGTYQYAAGGAGGALNGANSSLERWAISIGGTAAHEAGHTYGLSHADGQLIGSGEDALTRHIMPPGNLLTNEHRAGYRRHFNDKNFSVLAANVGLSVQTVHNWDSVNVNSSPASGLRLRVLSTAPALTKAWAYTGPLSPWGDPVISGPLGTSTFKGVTYNRFHVTWTAPKAWSNGPAGVVPPAVAFHVGAGFVGVDYSLPDPIIITETKLLNASGSPLPLSPRMVGYDTGTLDAVSGNFTVRLMNASPQVGPLLVRDVVVSHLPRLASIDSMIASARLRSWDGGRIRPWSVERPLEPKDGECSRPGCEKTLKDSIRLPIASLADGRNILEEIDGDACEAPADNLSGPEVNDCPNDGWQVDLFPSTSFHVSATVIDPKVRQWDRRAKRFVVGPLKTKVFFQVAGIHPDLNRNGIDDAIDIESGTSEDADENGVPDDARKAPRKQPRKQLL